MLYMVYVVHDGGMSYWMYVILDVCHIVMLYIVILYMVYGHVR